MLKSLFCLVLSSLSVANDVDTLLEPLSNPHRDTNLRLRRLVPAPAHPVPHSSPSTHGHSAPHGGPPNTSPRKYHDGDGKSVIDQGHVQEKIALFEQPIPRQRDSAATPERQSSHTLGGRGDVAAEHAVAVDPATVLAPERLTSKTLHKESNRKEVQAKPKKKKEKVDREKKKKEKVDHEKKKQVDHEKKKKEKVDHEKKNKGSKKMSESEAVVAPTKAYSYKKKFNKYEEPVSYPNKPNPELNAEVESIFSKYMIDLGTDGHGTPRIPKEYREAAFREAYEYALKNYKGKRSLDIGELNPFSMLWEGERKPVQPLKDLVKYRREQALGKDYIPRVTAFLHDHVPWQSRFEAIQHSYKLGNKKHIKPEDLNDVNIPQHFEYWRIMDPVEYPKFAREMGDVNSKEYKERRAEDMDMKQIRERNEELLREKELRLNKERENREKKLRSYFQESENDMKLGDRQFYRTLHLDRLRDLHE